MLSLDKKTAFGPFFHAHHKSPVGVSLLAKAVYQSQRQ